MNTPNTRELLDTLSSVVLGLHDESVDPEQITGNPSSDLAWHLGHNIDYIIGLRDLVGLAYEAGQRSATEA